MNHQCKLALFAVALFISTSSSAAVLIDLKNHQTDVLKSFVTGPHIRSDMPAIKEVNRSTDSNKTLHVRMQQYYRGYPIWNAHAVVHVPNANSTRSLTTLLTQSTDINSMNGKLYQNLEGDLNNASNAVFTKAQAERAIQAAIDHYKKMATNRTDITTNNAKSDALVFIDDHNIAHWGYKIIFDVPANTEGQLPAKPVFILDATNFKVHKSWDGIMTAESAAASVSSGGFGGNPNIGKIYYDSLSGHFPSFRVTRDAAGMCFMENKAVKVTHAVTNEVMHYPCKQKNANHNNIYWSGTFDTANSAYSPANDAMFAANVVKHLYQEWYGVPVLVNGDGSEMQLRMVVHIPKLDNAFWDGDHMSFGDGVELYPLTSLGISAHEVSHGFTQQHSDLNYEGESGGMNEAFSDMAAQAAEFYVYNRCSWRIGHEVFKIKDETLRYMDMPSKDCFGKEPGTSCSIDRAEQNYPGLDVHFSSGVYNRLFYLISTSPQWDPRKAFHVMVHANASYWVPETKFADGAACVIKAAEDLHYDVSAIKNAFKEVGVVPEERCTNIER